MYKAGGIDVDADAAAASASAPDEGARQNELSSAGHGEHSDSNECRAVVSTAIRIRNKISLEWQVSSGPVREAGAASATPGRCDAGESGDSPRDMDYTSDTQHEIRLLQRLGPQQRRHTGARRRRCRGASGVDALVAAAEKTAQQRHDALYGPFVGAGGLLTPAPLDLHSMD